MKGVCIVVVFTILSTGAFCQEKPGRDEFYQRHDQIQPFFRRWYWHLKGETTTIWIETLQLKDDHTFVHFTSTSCLPGITYGSWAKEKNRIILNPDSTWGTASSRHTLIISHRKLYYDQQSIEDGKWAMKKIH